MLNFENFQVQVRGHANITDDLGNVLLDKCNAIHPQNVARIFARALANENNYYVNRIAFGNGGTIVDAAYTITYRTPNDGQSPDVSTWDSRLYHETFSKIVNSSMNGVGGITQTNVLNPLLGTDPGSADINTSVRLGGGAVPFSDPVSIPHVSGPGVQSVELGITSQVVITATLNADEPKSQFLTDVQAPLEQTNETFMFDEIGLYTAGEQAISIGGYQYIDVGIKKSTDDTTLVPSTLYSFRVSVDNGTPLLVSFTTPSTGGSGINGEILYGDLCQAINTGSVSWGLSGVNPLPNGALLSITDNTGGTFPTITGAVTYGYLTISSPTVGTTSSMLLDSVSWATHETLTFVALLNAPLGATILDPISGNSAGLQNSPTTPLIERERLLAHLIFSPILKAANRRLNIIYTLTISVTRTPQQI
jgi:hypothetical protein